MPRVCARTVVPRLRNLLLRNPDRNPATGTRPELATLQTRLIDVLAGFRTMQEKAEPELRPIVDDYIATHSRHERELAERLVSLGREADDDGSFFSVGAEFGRAHTIGIYRSWHKYGPSDS